MGDVKVEFNDDLLKELRYSDETASMLEAIGERVKERADTALGEEGFAIDSRPGAARPQGRHRVSVKADTIHAKRADAKRNILVRALFG